MKKIFFLVSLFSIGTLFSCQQDESLTGNSEMAATPTGIINLQDFTYSDVAGLFDGANSVGNIRFMDGELIKDVKKISVNEAVEMKGDEAAEKTTFYTGAAQDSIDVVVSDEYASVKMIVGGYEYGYVAFADPARTAEAIADFESNIPATRAAKSVLTRGSSNPSSFKVNLTEASKYAPEVIDENCSTAPVEQEEQDSSEPVQTRSAYYTQWPRGNTLTIHLIRDAGNMPWEYEVTWQVNDMINSLKDIRPDLNVKVWRANTGYRATARYDELLGHFRNYCLNSSYPYREASGHDIIVLIRRFGYAGYFLGKAYVNSYKLSRYDNNSAFGIAATSSLYPKTLAHEVGHILGAGHVAARPWYQFWLRDDVMVPTNNTINMGYLHMNNNNRNNIWNNLH